MSNGDHLPLYSASQLSASLTLDSSCKFVALKIKREGQNTALHAIYIEQQAQPSDFPFVALVTVTEWDGKSEREEFFIEAESAELLMEKLQRFDEINNFVFIEAPSSSNIDMVTMQPQALCCMLFPELGTFDKAALEDALASLKSRTLIFLRELEGIAE